MGHSLPALLMITLFASGSLRPASVRPSCENTSTSSNALLGLPSRRIRMFVRLPTSKYVASLCAATAAALSDAVVNSSALLFLDSLLCFSLFSDRFSVWNVFL